MSKETAIILLGLWVAVIPLSGFPEAWRTVFIIAAGVALMVLGFYLRSRFLAHDAGRGNGAFVGNFINGMNPPAKHEKNQNERS